MDDSQSKDGKGGDELGSKRSRDLDPDDLEGSFWKQFGAVHKRVRAARTELKNAINAFNDLLVKTDLDAHHYCWPTCHALQDYDSQEVSG